MRKLHAKQTLMASLFILLGYSFSDHSVAQDLADKIQEHKDTWQGFVTEARINDLILELSSRDRPNTVLFEEVNLISMRDEAVLASKSVLVKDGRITQIGDVGTITVPEKAFRVDATGKYLMPGLTDAHVHIGESNVEKLLNLAAGVTTVREMAGFTWMLDYRNRIYDNEILAPTLYLTGPMLNSFSLGIYSQVVKTPEEARHRVQAQKAAGFDFIKVWNRMPLDLLEAIADEAEIQDIDLIGHIPHEATIEHVLSLGFKTVEHLTGYYLDSSLEITDEDYVAVSKAHSDYWISPTFAVSYYQSFHSEQSRRWLTEAIESKYVPSATKRQWMNADRDNNRLHIFNMQREIFMNLVENGIDNIIAGTDNNGSNAFMVAGFVLHKELQLMTKFGLPVFDVLKATTTNPALAMRREDEFGSIEVGKRADLLLLEQNPLDDLDHLLGNRGVMVRGMWLSGQEITEILDAIANIYHMEEEMDVLNYPIQAFNYLLTYYKEEKNQLILKPSSRMLFGRALIEIKKTEDAIDIMQLAVDRYPTYDVYEALADAYLSHGDTTQALRNYNKSIELYSYNQSAKDKINQVKGVSW